MSLLNEVNNTICHLKTSRNAIVGRGGNISETAGLKDLPEAIFNIPADTSLAFYEDSATAYKKSVPANVNPLAMVKRVGGKTRKCTNILGGEALANSIKSAIPAATIDTVNKTITFIANDAEKWGFTDVKPGTRYTVILYGYNKYVHATVGKGTNFAIHYANGSGYSQPRFELANEPSYSVHTSRADTDVSSIRGINYGGTTVLYYEQCGIFEGVLTKDDFEPYFEGLRSVKTTELKSEGADGILDTFAIPEAIQAIEGYGESNPENPEEYNYIDFDGFFVGKGRIVDGVWVAYEKPQKTDISHLMPSDTFVKVEGGGTITAVNEYEYDVPSTIKYVQKVGS